MCNVDIKEKNDLKKNIQEYWTKNVPYLIESDKPIGSKEFYLEIDLSRCNYEPYTLQLIESFSKSGKRMLEIGCGLGSDLRGFSRKGMNAIGMDISLDNALLVKNGFNILGLKGDALCADAENLPFKSQSLNLVYSFGVLHHTPDTQKAINEIHRVLKPDGECVVMLYQKGLAYCWISLLYFFRRLRGDKTSKNDLITQKYDHTPLSKMYSKNGAGSMFSNFKNLKISVVTFGGIQRHKKLWWVYYLLNVLPFLMNKFGSFLIIHGNK